MSTYHPELCDGESFMEITEDEAAMLRCVVAVNRRYAGQVRHYGRVAKLRYLHDMRCYSMRLSGLTYAAIAEACGLPPKVTSSSPSCRTCATSTRGCKRASTP